MRLYKFLFILIFAFTVQLGITQTFGVRAGLNYSTFLGPTEPDVNESFGFSNGFHFGLSYSYDFTDLFSLRTELVYIQNGSTYDYEGESFYIIRQSDKTTFEKGNLDFYELNNSNAYISIPIVANYRINKKWEVFGGGYINMLIGPTGRGQMKFVSEERPDEIRFIRSLDFRYNSDEPSEISGRSAGPLTEIGILVDGDIVTLPKFAGAHTLQGEKTGNMFNFLDFGLTAGAHYFLNKGFFVGLTIDYGIPDLTNNKVDFSLKELNPDNSFKFSDDKDSHFGIQASFGFRF
jgi:hypothetical protein